MNVDFGKWAFKYRRLVSLFIVLFLVGGIFSYYKISKLEDPEIVVRQALVVAINPGASAHQNELEVVDPLEKAVRTIPGVEFTESYAYSDMSFIKVSFSTTVDQDELPQKWDVLRKRVMAAELPDGVTLQVMDDFGDVYGMFYSITGEGFTPKQLSDYAELIQREVQNVEGVGRVNLYGVPEQCIRIQLRQDRLASLGVLPLEVVQTLSGQNATVYSGYFLSGGNRIRVSVDDRYRSVKDIASLLIQGHESDQLRLSDIADIVIDEVTPVREAMERDGKRAIGLSISGQSGTDIIKVGAAVEKKLSELQRNRIPVGIEIEKVFNQPDKVREAMGSFMLNLLMSVLLVVLVLALTMGFRSAIIIGISLVTIVSGTILILFYSGGTIQRVSLCSFIMAMGMLVDNAIVIVDGILVARSQGLPREEALTGIGRKTAWPLLCATLIAILSFIPIFLSPDVTGLYVHDMFIVLAVSLLLSWILALTHVPIMANRWLFATPVKSPESQRNSKPYLWLRNVLSVLLHHRWTTVICIVILLGLAGIGALYMPRAFFPDMEYDQLYMEYKLPEGRNYTQVQSDLDSIRNYISQYPEVKHVVTSIGGTPSRYNLVRSIHLPSLAYGELIIDFTSPKALQKTYRQLQREVSEMFPDAYVRFKRYNLMFLPYPIQVGFNGPDPAVLKELSDTCIQIINNLQVCENVTKEWEPATPAYVIGYDQASARRIGLTRQEVGMSILASTDGIPVGTFYDGTHQMSIYVDCVDVNGEPLKDISSATVFGLTPSIMGLANLDFRNLDKESVLQTLAKNAPVAQVTDGLRVEWEDPVVYRYKGNRNIFIGAVPAEGYGTEQARKMIEKEISKIELPEGYFYEWYGERMAEDLSMENLFSFYPIAIIIIIALLLLLFNNFKTVALLLCSIPVVFVGIVPAMLLTGFNFGFVAVVGALGLVGMIIKNGIILVDEINLQVQQDNDFHEAIIEASLSRLRPVTMAAFTTVLGMVPLLFDAMFGSLAATIMGGLIVGTVIVLLFIPVLYSLFFKRNNQ